MTSQNRRETRHLTETVHPECARLSNVYAHCTCEMLWGYRTDLDELCRVYQRLDRRTRSARHGSPKGRGPDRDEPTQSTVNDSESIGIDAYENHLSTDLEAYGFWKESEFLEQFTTKKKLDSS